MQTSWSKLEHPAGALHLFFMCPEGCASRPAKLCRPTTHVARTGPLHRASFPRQSSSCPQSSTGRPQQHLGRTRDVGIETQAKGGQDFPHAPVNPSRARGAPPWTSPRRAPCPQDNSYRGTQAVRGPRKHEFLDLAPSVVKKAQRILTHCRDYSQTR